MSMPTTYEGWLKAVKECDLLNARSLAIELSGRFGESDGVYYNALSRARYFEKIANMQQSYAKALHEHLSPTPVPITEQQWKMVFLHQFPTGGDYARIDNFILEKTGVSVFNTFEPLAKYLAGLKLTLKDGESL